MKQKTSEQIAIHVSLVSILGNLVLSSFKLFAGIIAHSSAMVSDAVHSASDVLSTLIVIVGVKVSNKSSDKEHPYGHERMECVAAILLAILLGITGVGIGYAGLIKIISPHGSTLVVPGRLALAAAILSILTQEWMYQYTKYHARRINSGALMADAWHHRSDALSSVGSFAGILGARLGFPILDPLASVVICLYIIKAAFDIFKDAIDKLTDRACDDGLIVQLKAVITAQDGVLGIDQLKTRLFGDKIYVDVEIRADGSVTLTCAHAIAEKIHVAIETQFPQVKHCMVHVNPVELSRSPWIQK